MDSSLPGWRTQVFSDVEHDGLGIELLDRHDNIVADVFRCDADHSVTITVYQGPLPPTVEEWLCQLAEARLGPTFEDGVAMHSRAEWVRSAA